MNRFFFRFAGLLWLAVSICACQSEQGSRQATIHTLSTNGSYPTTALSTTGEAAYVVWMETIDDKPGIYFASSKVDNGFNAPVRVNNLPGDAATGSQAPPLVASGPNGEIYVVWQVQQEVKGRRFPASNLRFSSSKDGGATFAPAIFVNEDADEFPTGHTFHSMAVDPEGLIYVAWIDSRRRDSARRTTQQSPGKAPVTEVPNAEIRLARSVDGGVSFEASVVVDEDACPCCKTALAVGRNRHIYLSYRKILPGSIRDIVVTQSADHANTFADPIRVAADNWQFDGCPHNGPYLALDYKDQLHVSWFTGKEGFAGNYYTKASPDLTFDAPLRLAPGSIASPTRSSLSTDPRSTPWFTCEAPNDSGSSVYLTSTTKDGALEIVHNLGNGAFPSQAADKNNLIVSWIDGSAVKAYIHPLNEAVSE